MSEKNLPILRLISSLDNSVVEVTIIGSDAYYITCKLKKVKVFAIFIKDLEFQAAREAKLETNLKSIIPDKVVSWFFKCVFKNKLRYTLFSSKIWSKNHIEEK